MWMFLLGLLTGTSIMGLLGMLIVATLMRQLIVPFNDLIKMGIDITKTSEGNRVTRH